jgi:hypothetical protein
MTAMLDLTEYATFHVTYSIVKDDRGWKPFGGSVTSLGMFFMILPNPA